VQVPTLVVECLRCGQLREVNDPADHAAGRRDTV